MTNYSYDDFVKIVDIDLAPLGAVIQLEDGLNNATDLVAGVHTRAPGFALFSMIKIAAMLNRIAGVEPGVPIVHSVRSVHDAPLGCECDPAQLSHDKKVAHALSVGLSLQSLVNVHGQYSNDVFEFALSIVQDKQETEQCDGVWASLVSMVMIVQMFFALNKRCPVDDCDTGQPVVLHLHPFLFVKQD